MTPLVSIILPCYNVEKYIEKAVNSILQQSLENYEVIFVDDGSTDNTVKKIENLNLEEKFKVFSKVNEGSGFARNFGLEKSKGKFIYFMDPDDEINPDLLRKSVDKIESEKSDLLMFGYQRINEINGKKRNFQPDKEFIFSTPENVKENFPLIFGQSSAYAVWNKLYRKSFLEESNLKFSNLPIGQDAEFNIRVFGTVKSLKIIPDVLYYYLYNRNGSARTNHNKKKYNSEIQILERLTELFIFWDLKDDYKYILDNHIINLVYEEIHNMKKAKINIKFDYIDESLLKRIKSMKIRSKSGINMKVKLIIIKLILIKDTML